MTNGNKPKHLWAKREATAVIEGQMTPEEAVEYRAERKAQRKALHEKARENANRKRRLAKIDRRSKPKRKGKKGKGKSKSV